MFARNCLIFFSCIGVAAALPDRLGATPLNPATASFQVTITIVKECVVTPPAIINFGIVGAAGLSGGTLNTTQPFGVLCSKGTPYTIGFASPNDLTVGSAVHQMKGTLLNTDVVRYNLLDVTLGATNLSPLSASASVIADTGTGLLQTKSLKALLLGDTGAISSDVYLDTVTMSVSY